MKIKKYGSGYILWLSARDTDNWATRPNNVWPCSALRGKRLMVCVDSNGLYDLTVNGKYSPGYVDGSEIDAIVSDFQPDDVKHLWPRWEF